MKLVSQKRGTVQVFTRNAGNQDQSMIDEVLVCDSYRVDCLCRILPVPKVIMDIGGHIGCFGLRAKVAWPEARIVAFEPNPESAMLYRCNMERNGFQHWQIHECAVSYETEKTVLAEHVGAASSGGILTTPELIDTLPGLRTVSNPNVEVHTMERAVQDAAAGGDIDLLKIDCEGGELSIFRDMLPETADKIKFIVGEYHMKDGGYYGFVELLRKRFPHFSVMPLGPVSSFIGLFAAGPPEYIARLQNADTADAVAAVRTPKNSTLTLSFYRGARVDITGNTQAEYKIRFENSQTG